jgi:hypothetical protein
VLLSLSLLVKKEENLGKGGKKAGKATMGLAKEYRETRHNGTD